MSSHPPSVTVFVNRQNGIFVARTHNADAMHPSSAEGAARRCGARHLAVPESEIDVLLDGEHVMIATLRQPGNPVATVLFVWAATIGAMAVALIVWLVKGGA